MSQCYEEKKQIAQEKSELMKMQREIIQKTNDDRNSTMKVSNFILLVRPRGSEL